VGTLAGSGADASKFEGQAEEIARAMGGAQAPAKPTGPGNAPLVSALAALAAAGIAVWAALSLAGN
jgi:hypothetical protein